MEVNETENQNSSKSESEEEKSSTLLLNIIQKEFEYEESRNSALQNRAGIFISFIGVIITLYTSYVKFGDIFNRKPETIGSTLLILMYFILGISLFLGLVISLILFVMVLSTRKYTRIGLEGFIGENAQNKVGDLAGAIMENYKDVLEHNININNRKAKYFQIACIILTISIIFIPIVIGISPFL